VRFESAAFAGHRLPAMPALRWEDVGVRGCSGRNEKLKRVAYVEDTFWRREYRCAGCLRDERERLAEELARVNLPHARRERVVKELTRLTAAKPSPCIVCGRRFAWLGGDGPRAGADGVVTLGETYRLPRPRLHICSDVCRREHRNAKRRVRHRRKRCTDPTCGVWFVPSSAIHDYHSAACRKRAQRQRQAGLGG